MAQSEKDLLVASQIAYYDISQEDEGKSIREILNQKEYIKNALVNETLKDEVKNDPVLKLRADRALQLYDEIVKEPSKYGDWILKEVHDTNNTNGFFGCMLETSENSAIIGFRGSESFSDPHHLEQDWIKGDLGLLNSTHTDQQNEAQKFMERIQNRPDLNNYDNYALTGHSLGGNLATHATLTAPEQLQSKITQSYNLDGPGFSDEYLRYHEKAIAKMGSKIDHIQWSLVGAILNPIPNSRFRSIMTDQAVYTQTDMHTGINKHDTGFVIFAGESFVQGEMDPFSKKIGDLTRSIDDCPSIVGNLLVGLVTYLASTTLEERLYIGGFIIIGLVTVTLASTAVVAGVVLLTCALLLADALFPGFFEEVLLPFMLTTGTMLFETIEFVSDVIIARLKSILSVAAFSIDTINLVLSAVASVFKSFFSAVGRMFEGGGGGSYEVIKVDVNRLRQHAEVLKRINRRIVNIDQRFDDLYLKVGFDKILGLISADIQTSYSWKLNQCINYLEDTATRFERNEAHLMNKAHSF